MSYSKELVVLEYVPEVRRVPLGHVVVALLAAGLIAALASLTTAPALPFASGGQVALAASPGTLAIDVAPMMVAEPLKETPLPIQLVPAELVPRGSWLKIGGLPELASLSDGHVTGPGAWRVPVASIPALKVIAPAGARAEIVITLTSSDGAELTRARSVLLVAQASNIGADTAKRSPSAPEPALGRDSASALSRQDAIRRAQSLVRRGDDSMVDGNVTTARAFYERATRMGWSQAAMALAATFDPNAAHQRWGIAGLAADPVAARTWYAKARELLEAESAEIDVFLAGLDPKSP